MTMPKDRYDVVVCGAGPAGSTLARALSSKGFSVALLDRDEFPRDKACGGALRPDIIDEDQELRARSKNISVSPVRSITLVSQSLEHSASLEEKETIMYNIKRREFDSLLVEMAVDSGAQLFTGTTARGVELGDGGVTVETRARDFKGRLAVSAGGVFCPVAKAIRKRNGEPARLKKDSMGLVVMKELPVDNDFIKGHYGEGYASHFYLAYKGMPGYAWVFPKDGAINIGYGAFWRTMAQLDVRSEFEGFLRHLKGKGMVPSDAPLGDFRGAPIPLRGPIHRTYSDRALVIGDAAGFVSPLTGDGICYAMDTARMAADVAARGLGEDKLDAGHLRAYEDAWRAHWPGEFDALCRFADIVMDRSDMLIRLASRDQVLLREMVRVAGGLSSASKHYGRIKRRAVRDILLYDVIHL